MSLPNRSAQVLRRLSLAVAALTLGLSACESGVVHDPATEVALSQCGNSVAGSRYTVCGRLTAAGFSGPGARVSARATLDAAPQPSGNRYSIQEGSFHVSR